MKCYNMPYLIMIKAWNQEEIKFTPDYEASEIWTVFRDLSRTMIMDWLATTNYKKD